MSLVLLVLLLRHASSEGVTHLFRRRGEAILLTSDALRTRRTDSYDFRWKRSDQLILRQGNVTKACVPPCELRVDGSLSLSGLQSAHSGNYSLDVYSERDGRLLQHKHFVLTVLQPVSRPELSASCSLGGRVQLQCHVQDGERVRIHWIHTATTGSANHSLPLRPAHSHWAGLLLGRKVNGSICVASNEVSEEKSAPVHLECRVGG
ncbi:uncharacterized protein LOC115371030 [Myripristis murdjan]|uniref:uncharacterized protein LOC115371030 n=1 Tax=Myripristis murdjan TaxID=586833 RepID=UPI001175C9AA|nr:uncharacterized protein LOC115371030 [Myripristis murdjan]